MLSVYRADLGESWGVDDMDYILSSSDGDKLLVLWKHCFPNLYRKYIGFQYFESVSFPEQYLPSGAACDNILTVGREINRSYFIRACENSSKAPTMDKLHNEANQQY